MTNRATGRARSKKAASAAKKSPKRAKKRPSKTATSSLAVAAAVSTSSGTDALFDRIVSILEEARSRVARAVNTEMVLAYWHIGQEIVQHMQSGEARAEYGQQLIDDLSARLTRRYGRGFSTTNLRYLRTFFQVYADRVPEIRHMAGGESGGPIAGPKSGDKTHRIRHTTRGVLDDLSRAASSTSPFRGFSPVLGWSH